MNSCKPENFACVVVDMVNGFVKAGAMADPAIMGITPAIVRVLERTDESRRIFFADTHEKDCIEFAAFPPHCVRGTEESEIIDKLKPYVTAGIIPKNSTNGFHAIKDLSVFSGVDSVVVTGCCTDICVLQFALTLKTWFNENDLKKDVIIPRDCVDTYNAPGHDRDAFNDMALTLMQNAGIIVTDSIF